MEELAGEFDQGIVDIVAEVTDDKSLPKAARKRLQVEHAPHPGRKAKYVKLADKIKPNSTKRMRPGPRRNDAH